MSQADLPASFWGHALETAMFTLNRVPSKAVEKTPYEIWNGKKPIMSYLKVWGCEVYVKQTINYLPKGACWVPQGNEGILCLLPI